MDQRTILKEMVKCSRDPAYFIDRYVFIENATERAWIRFRLWPAQRRTLRVILKNRYVVILKARQLGISWLSLGYALWLMIFRPISTVLLCSKRDDEAVNLLRDRLKGMYTRLPEWMKAKSLLIENDHALQLSTGSVARALSTSGADSYTGTLVLGDEADLIDDLDRWLGATKPTVDAGGQILLVSRVDKRKPNSPFKNIYRGAKKNANGWAYVFLPWWERPGRDQKWYAGIKAEILERTGSLDELHEQYPASDIEALSPNTKDKRIPAEWLQQCYVESDPVSPAGAPAIPDLEIYEAPDPGRHYFIGADPAEGNPNSDDSSATVVDQTGIEVACFAGHHEPATFADYLDLLAGYFNGAGILPERNNHGHAVILRLRENGKSQLLKGLDDKAGWYESERGKAQLYSDGADAFKNSECKIRSFETFVQLSSIEGATLSAPAGDHDDRATSYLLALEAINRSLSDDDLKIW